MLFYSLACAIDRSIDRAGVSGRAAAEEEARHSAPRGASPGRGAEGVRVPPTNPGFRLDGDQGIGGILDAPVTDARVAPAVRSFRGPLFTSRTPTEPSDAAFRGRTRTSDDFGWTTNEKVRLTYRTSYVNVTRRGSCWAYRRNWTQQKSHNCTQTKLTMRIPTCCMRRRALPLFGATLLAVGAASGAAAATAMIRSDPMRISRHNRPPWTANPQQQRSAMTMRLMSSSSSAAAPTSTTSFAAIRTGPALSRSQASKIMDETILPQADYGSRLGVGGDAQGLTDQAGGAVGAVSAQDPRLAFTYGEFPLTSLDALLDRAETYCGSNHDMYKGQYDDPTRTRRRLRFVDVGSGCGRLCLYVGLTRPNWDVSGIECAPLLHQQAVLATERAIQAGYMRALEEDPARPSYGASKLSSVVHFHCAMAGDASSVLSKADIVFAYSTTWESSGFSTASSSMLLSEPWQQLFTASCMPGCVVITTDRSLDASTTVATSWEMLEQVDVGNPEVGGSAGYIQQRV
jgi:hypothetical protein